jgi:hypothetical protein
MNMQERWEEERKSKGLDRTDSSRIKEKRRELVSLKRKEKQETSK